MSRLLDAVVDWATEPFSGNWRIMLVAGVPAVTVGLLLQYIGGIL